MKWLFPAAMFVSSLVLLAAAHRAQPPRPPLGVVYHDRLLDADPVAAGLARVETERLRLNASGATATHLALDDRPNLEKLIADDGPELDAGLRQSRDLYRDFLAASMTVSIDALHREAQQEFARYAEERYRAMIEEFDAALAKLEIETMDEPLREERLRLLNLRLALGALTRDRIALSPVRIEQLESELQTLLFVLEIKRRRGQRLFSIKEKRTFEELQNLTQSGMDEKSRDIDARLNELIAGIKTNAEALISGHEAEQQRTREQARRRRQDMADAAKDMYTRAPGAAPAGARNTRPLEQYLDLFYDTLRARAAAAAVDSGAFLVLDAPLYAAPGVRDLTGELGLPAAPAHGGKQ